MNEEIGWYWVEMLEVFENYGFTARRRFAVDGRRGTCLQK